MQKIHDIYYIHVWKYAHIYSASIALNNGYKYCKNLKYCIYR